MSVDIVLDAFEFTIQMDLSGSLPNEAELSLSGIDAMASIDVDLAAMQSIFAFHSDSTDMTNVAANDLLYSVYSSANTGFGGVDLIETNVANALVVDLSGISVGAVLQNVSHDFVRHLALKLFGTHFGVDLFTNEPELIANIQKICGNDDTDYVWGNIMSIATAHGQNQPYDVATPNNICYQLFTQIISVAPGRFGSLTSTANASDANEYQVPLLAGDTIQFKLTIKAADDQEELTGAAAIPDRVYGIKLVLTAA